MPRVGPTPTVRGLLYTLHHGVKICETANVVTTNAVTPKEGLGSRWLEMGPSVIDFPVCGRPPTPSEGPGPLRRK